MLMETCCVQMLAQTLFLQALSSPIPAAAVCSKTLHFETLPQLPTHPFTVTCMPFVGGEVHRLKQASEVRMQELKLF